MLITSHFSVGDKPHCLTIKRKAKPVLTLTSITGVRNFTSTSGLLDFKQRRFFKLKYSTADRNRFYMIFFYGRRNHNLVITSGRRNRICKRIARSNAKRQHQKK